MVKLKKNKETRDRPLNIKLTKSEKKAMVENARRFADGNLSLWLRYAGVNYVPRRADTI